MSTCTISVTCNIIINEFLNVEFKYNDSEKIVLIIYNNKRHVWISRHIYVIVDGIVLCHGS